VKGRETRFSIAHKNIPLQAYLMIAIWFINALAKSLMFYKKI
jgi:hypothetical protein